jgi:D-alanyl-D-alanine dipeptidase
MKNVYIIIGLLLIGCTSKSTNTNKSEDKSAYEYSASIKKNIQQYDSLSKDKKTNFNYGLLISNLIDVQSINKDIMVDIKYASKDNFMRQRLYKRIDKAFLQKDVAERLSKSQDYLSKLNPNLHLLVYDAVRPISVQWEMWKALDSIPEKERVKFVSNPINRSVHNYGAAVDLTICNSKGEPLDMGANFDDIRKIAYPSLEAHFLSTGELTKNQIANRVLLRKVMQSQGFRNIPTEWWHFNACSRKEAKLKYVSLETEP